MSEWQPARILGRVHLNEPPGEGRKKLMAAVVMVKEIPISRVDDPECDGRHFEMRVEDMKKCGAVIFEDGFMFTVVCEHEILTD